MASDGCPDLVSSKDFLPRLYSPTQNLTCAYDGAEDPYTLVNSQCNSWPVFSFKYKYPITARYSTFEEKLVFASLACLTFNILWVKDTIRVQCLLSGIKHVLKQGMKIVGVSVNWKWDRLVTYWLALVRWPPWLPSWKSILNFSWTERSVNSKRFWLSGKRYRAILSVLSYDTQYYAYSCKTVFENHFHLFDSV